MVLPWVIASGTSKRLAILQPLWPRSYTAVNFSISALPLCTARFVSKTTRTTNTVPRTPPRAPLQPSLNPPIPARRWQRTRVVLILCVGYKGHKINEGKESLHEREGLPHGAYAGELPQAQRLHVSGQGGRRTRRPALHLQRVRGEG